MTLLSEPIVSSKEVERALSVCTVWLPDEWFRSTDRGFLEREGGGIFLFFFNFFSRKTSGKIGHF